MACACVQISGLTRGLPLPLSGSACLCPCATFSQNAAPRLPSCLQFDRLVPNAWRVANCNDAVTLVPRLCGYCHVGHKAQLGAEGRVELTSEQAASWIELPSGLPAGFGAPLSPHFPAARLLPVAGNSSQVLGEGTAAAEMALAAAVNLPKLTEQLLAQEALKGSGSGNDGSANVVSSGSSMLQQNKSSLLSAAAAVAAAATAFADAVQQQQQQLQEGQPGSSSSSIAGSGAASSAVAAAGVAPTSAQDVQALLEEEVNAMNCLLDGRWVVAAACAKLCCLPPWFCTR